MITVLLADDHALVRDSLVELFSASGDLTVVAACEDGAQVLDAARAGRLAPAGLGQPGEHTPTAAD